MSTQLPVTAFGIFLGEKGAIRRQVTVMRQCSSEQEQTFDENVNSRQRKSDVATQTREQAITKQVKKPVEVVVSTMPVKKPVQKPTKTTGVSVQTKTPVKNNTDALNIATVWQLMSIYQEQTGE
jgi:cytoskeletal protein RodZ